MKRETKFRGKRLDGKGWAVGDLVHIGDGTIIITNSKLGPDLPEDCGHALQYDESEFAVVDSETVGEYIGIKGENKREIYEDDIVKAWSEGSCIVGVIKRRNDGFWLIYPAYQHGRFWHIMPDKRCNDDGVEVIGNIHDNPELLKTE